MEYGTDWIIAETSTEEEADVTTIPELYRFWGTKEDVRKLLVHLIHRLKMEEEYCSGTETEDDVAEFGSYVLQAKADYGSYKITLTAKKFSRLEKFTTLD